MKADIAVFVLAVAIFAAFVVAFISIIGLIWSGEVVWLNVLSTALATMVFLGIIEWVLIAWVET